MGKGRSITPVSSVGWEYKKERGKLLASLFFLLFHAGTGAGFEIPTECVLRLS